MMSLSRYVLVAAVMGGFLGLAGCKQKAATGAKSPESSPERLMQDLKTAGDVFQIRMAAAVQLEQLPPEQLKPLIKELKEALGKETDPRVKSIIQRVLKKAE